MWGTEYCVSWHMLGVFMIIMRAMGVIGLLGAWSRLKADAAIISRVLVQIAMLKFTKV
jgi:hypothetical protein